MITLYNSQNYYIKNEQIWVDIKMLKIKLNSFLSLFYSKYRYKNAIFTKYFENNLKSNVTTSFKFI